MNPLDKVYLRKLNILTSKDRPFCAFCNALCGFTWHFKNQGADSYSLCQKCFNKGNYPTAVSENDFETKQISDLQWEKLHKELTPELEQAAKARPNSNLTKE